jgi:Transposase DDE domain
LEPVIKPADLDFITTLRAPAIRKLVETGDLQLALFDDRNLAEITSPDYPNERLVVCRHPVLADERELLDAIERKLRDIQTRVRCDNKPLRGQDAIAIAVGSVINRYNMSKHFDVTITDNDLVFERKRQPMDVEAALDGIYVIRTSVKAEDLDSISIVQAYKGRGHVERAFHSLETFDLEMRPIYHRLRAHVLLCMLAYHVEWHMRQALKPVLFDDYDELAVEATRRSVVVAPPRLEAAQCNATTQGTDDNLPVHSFRSLMADLATFTRNTMAMADSPDATFLLYPELTPVQQRTFQLLDVPAQL